MVADRQHLAGEAIPGWLLGKRRPDEDCEREPEHQQGHKAVLGVDSPVWMRLHPAWVLGCEPALHMAVGGPRARAVLGSVRLGCAHGDYSTPEQQSGGQQGGQAW
jgi:hypothetical protein